MSKDQQSFGELLRGFRRARGLTQDDLAELAGLSQRAVSDLERGLRRAPYADTVDRLVNAMQLRSAEQAALQAARRPRLGQQPPTRLGLNSEPPVPLTSFIGRERELGELQQLLTSARLVTLTGAGGVGKTRLALEAARRLGERFQDGVRFVSLAGVGSPALLPAAIAAGLDLAFFGSAEPRDQLVNFLREKQLLLVLDNFEQLLGGTEFVSDILRGAPAVTILATSRERMNVSEEWVVSIDGLTFPDTGTKGRPPDEYPAVQLFAHRAEQVHHGFSLVDNLESVLRICGQVAGMPLALELAASWVRLMPCEQIAVEIDRSLDFLISPLRDIPERHRSLRAVFDRSWSLLSESERTVLSALSVFRGGFNLHAAAEVAGASLDVMAGLVDKSMLRAIPNGRYELHDLLRQYLVEKLAACGGTRELARRHFDFYRRLASLAEAQQYGPEEETWYDRLAFEQDNIAAALGWSITEADGDDALRLATSLESYWERRARFHEAYWWFANILDSARGASASVRARALASAGVFASFLGRSAEAVPLCEEALATARRVADQQAIAWSLANLALIHHIRNADEVREAVGWLEEALRLFRLVGDEWGTSHALRRLGWALIVAGEYEQALRLLEEALRRARTAHNKDAAAWSLYLLGKAVWLSTMDAARTTALHEESLSLARQAADAHLVQQVLVALGQTAYVSLNYAQAISRYDEVVAMARERGGPAYPDWFLEPVVRGLAQVAASTGRLETAAMLFGAAHQEVADTRHIFAEPIDLESAIASVRNQLGRSRFAAAFGRGRAMSIADAIDYLLGERARRDAPGPGKHTPLSTA